MPVWHDTLRATPAAAPRLTRRATCRLDGRVPKASAPDERDTRLVRDVNVVLREYIDGARCAALCCAAADTTTPASRTSLRAALESVKLRQGLRCVMEVSRLGNQYLQVRVPAPAPAPAPAQPHARSRTALKCRRARERGLCLCGGGQDAAPWKMMKSDPERAHTTLAVAISLIKASPALHGRGRPAANAPHCGSCWRRWRSHTCLALRTRCTTS